VHYLKLDLLRPSAVDTPMGFTHWFVKDRLSGSLTTGSLSRGMCRTPKGYQAQLRNVQSGQHKGCGYRSKHTLVAEYDPDLGREAVDLRWINCALLSYHPECCLCDHGVGKWHCGKHGALE